MKRRIKPIDVIVTLICAALLVCGVVYANRAEKKGSDPNYSVNYELVRVTQVLFEDYTVDDDSEGALRGSQSLNVVLLTGRHKGDTLTIKNYLGPMHEKLAKKGTVLTVTVTEDLREEGYQLSVVNYDYTWLIVGMIVLFIAAVVLVGRKKGLMSLLGLAVSLAAIVFFLIPMWLKGYKAIPLTLLTCVFIAVFSFTLLGGVTKKTVSAMLGTVLCVLVACGFGMLCGRIARLSGNNMREAEWLLDESRSMSGITLNIRGLLVSGVIISALGAVMDVSMSIASSVSELHDVDPTLTAGRLFKSGMNIGRDLIGTMTNTLILAFAGSSFNIMIIMFIAGMQPYQLLNNNDTMIELIRAIAGSLGLILAVPLTAAVASALSGMKRKTKN